MATGRLNGQNPIKTEFFKERCDSGEQSQFA